MKRVLVLAVVLGLTVGAQAAMAGLKIQINGNDVGATYNLAVNQSVTVDITSTDAKNYTTYLELADAGKEGLGLTPLNAQWSNPALTANAGGLSSLTVNPDGYLSNYGVIIAGVTPTAPIAGIDFTVTLTCLKGTPGHDATVLLYADDFTTVMQQVTIHQTPEPMTMCLLGLGGLFLRRRSK